MGIKQHTEDILKDFEFIKIDQQPSNEDLNQLPIESTTTASSISTTNGGGQHVFAGMILPETEYFLISHNAEPVAVLTNPGPDPFTVDTEFETYQGVQNFLHKAIIKAIGKEWLAEIKSKTMISIKKLPRNSSTISEKFVETLIT
ncbi:hypothetical protein ACHAW6_006508 [Cyclotella cf. meneghiniana]